MRQSRKMISKAIASSVCDPVMPSMKTRSRANDVITITASKIWNKRNRGEIRHEKITKRLFQLSRQNRGMKIIAQTKFSTDLK